MILADGTITATARPNFPWTDTHTATRDNDKLWKVDRPIPLNYNIPMAWHHMIPWRYLRDGWSALATSQRWKVLAAWIDTWNLDIATDTLIAAMQTGTLGTPNNATMYDKLCWNQLNLVEGPNGDCRTDDPGSDKFDVFEGKAMSTNLRNRSQTLKSIFTVIKPWAPTFAGVTDKDAKSLIQDFAKLRTYNNTPISMFDPKLWVLQVDGKYDAFGNASRHPTWKKAA